MEGVQEMARKLVLLHMKHPNWYVFLNALVNIFVKGLPFTIYCWLDGSIWLTGGMNSSQSALYGVMNVMLFFMSFLAGMMMYLFFLGMWQLFKLLTCSYKKVNIRVHIFGIIIRLGRKKILESGDKEAIEALEIYDEAVEIREEKIYQGKVKADNRRREKDERDLEFAKEQRDWQRRHAADSEYAAEVNYRKARNGGGWFTSAEEEAKEGNKNMQNAHYHREQAAREEQRIAELERRLRK